MNKHLSRIWVRCELWEEIPANMWGEATDPRLAFETALAFTSDYRLYGSYMQRVIHEWPNSCANALTDSSLNQKAWLGHAAVALAHNIPQDITRKAWGFLTNEQRALANQEAARAIQQWKQNNIRKSDGVCGNMEKSLLL